MTMTDSYYKLTDQDFKTRKGYANETLWGEGVTHTAAGDGGGLCSDGLIHWYVSPELALLLNPIHAKISNPIVWEVMVSGRTVREGDIKGGSQIVTTLRQIKAAEPTTTQRIAFALLCAKFVYHNDSFCSCADAWLAGDDRAEVAAARASREAEWTAWADAWATAWATDPDAAARAPAWTADAAAWAAASAAAAAARAAAWAADAAARAGRTIDLPGLARQALANEWNGEGTINHD